MSGASRERRAGTRVILDMESSLVLYQAELTQRTTLGNISEGGCYLPVSQEFLVGERCHMELIVGEGLLEERVKLTGVVVRSDGKGLGIQFTDLDSAQNMSLQRILSMNGKVAS